MRPPRRSYAAAASAGGKLYIFGGCGEGCTGRLNDLWEFDPAANRWRQLPSSDAIKVGGVGAVWCFVRWWGHLYSGAGHAAAAGPACPCLWLSRLMQILSAACCLGPLSATIPRHLFPPPASHAQGRGGPGFVAVLGALFVVAGFAGHETNDVHRRAALNRAPVCDVQVYCAAREIPSSSCRQCGGLLVSRELGLCHFAAPGGCLADSLLTGLSAHPVLAGLTWQPSGGRLRRQLRRPAAGTPAP